MSTVRRAQAKVDLGAIERNARLLGRELEAAVQARKGEAGRRASPALLCAVVKADGYGHGATAAARSSLAGGASWLAVAGSTEAARLRGAGIEEVPILVMGALSQLELAEALEADADVVVWREQDIRAVEAAGGGRVHVKLDSGMGRLGTRDAVAATQVVDAVLQSQSVTLAGLMTHFATADDHGDGEFFQSQLDAFAQWVAPVKAKHPEVIVHAANSAALLRDPRSHFDMARCGIALYGIDPFGRDPRQLGLEPALELCSWVAEVKCCQTGDSAGYGRSFVAERDTYLGVLPIGYGDGWRRALSNTGEVLVGGSRRPLVGTVSMDSLTVDLGPEPSALELLGSEAILIGPQGSERIFAEEVASKIGTIGYEVTCGLTGRVPRIYRRDGTHVQLHEGAQEQSLGRAR